MTKIIKTPKNKLKSLLAKTNNGMVDDKKVVSQCLVVDESDAEQDEYEIGLDGDLLGGGYYHVSEGVNYDGANRLPKGLINEFMVDKNSNFVSRDGVFFILYKGDLLFFDEKNKKLLDSFFDRHYDELSDFIYEYNTKKYSVSSFYFTNFMDWIGARVPYLITGYISNQKDVYITANENYDVLNSNELYQLVKTFPKCNIYLGYKLVDKNKVLSNKGQSMPDYFYHGTILKNVIDILKNGIKPKPEDSLYKIKHDKTVFITSSFEQAKWYANFSSSKRAVFENWAIKPCVLKIDASKIDSNKIVYDYDVYNMHKVNKDDSTYNDRMKELNLSYNNNTYTIDNQDPRKFLKVGYRGVIMPNAVVSVYLVDYTNKHTEVPRDEFIEYAMKMNDKVAENVELDNLRVGGNGYHINESANFDSSEIGAVNYSWDFDEDEYQEWLEEAEYENTQESLMEYINDYVEFELEYLDNETYHTCGTDYVDYDALEDMFGSKMQNEILTTCMSDGSGSFETVNLYSDDDIDVNNQDSISNIAMKLLRHGDYFKDCRGFILTNGVVVYTESEHNEICRIPNINNKFDFIRMGNIRVLPQSIDIGDKPTSEQRDVLRRVIASYADEELYLDIYQGKSSIGAKYIHPDWRYVIGEIDRFYSEGIKPQGNEYYESKNSKKQIVENKYDDLFNKANYDLQYFQKQCKEKYGTPNWYISSWMEKTHPEISVDPKDIKIYTALCDKLHKITRLWSDENNKEESEKNLQQPTQDYDIISLAVEEFGLTSRLNQAGYILPDGKLLNFGRDGYRETDHRQIAFVYKQNGIKIWDDEYRYNYVVDFMNHGAIRCDVNSGILDMTQEPTNEQFYTIKDFVRKAVDVDIDFTDDKGNTLHSVSYSDAKPQAVVADIRRYYEDGIKPMGNIRYESKNNQTMGANKMDNMATPSLVLENSTDRRVNAIIAKYANVDDFQEIRNIRAKILKLIPNARAKNDMYLGAVAMFYLNGCLEDNEYRYKLNYLLGKLHSGHSFGYQGFLGSKDFGMTSFDEIHWNLIRNILDKCIPSEGSVGSYATAEKRTKVGNYTIFRLDSYDDAKYLNTVLVHSPWCILEDDDAFFQMTDGYTVYICIKDGYHQVHPISYDQLLDTLREKNMTDVADAVEEEFQDDDIDFYDDVADEIASADDEAAELLFNDDSFRLGLPPCDEYGLSMFVVMVSNFKQSLGQIAATYSRYNLPNLWDGSFLSLDELSQVIGADAKSVFKPHVNDNISELKKVNKKIFINEDSLDKLKGLIVKENLEYEVDSSDIDLSSFKKKDNLAPSLWRGGTLNPRARLKLLDIADDFWSFVNITWVKPKSIILTGSICNYNWSEHSDIDLHLVVDFSEIDEKKEFVKEYLDAKKIQWNEEHDTLTIYGFKVELYAQDVDEGTESGGIYDLENNKWIKEPSKGEIKPIGIEKYTIKDNASKIMTIIDNMRDAFVSAEDSHVVDEIGEDADLLWAKVRQMRKDSLSSDGEMGIGNITYKVLRRTGYLDKLWSLKSMVYNKQNSINESTTKHDAEYIFDAAKKRFGVTYDVRECGYVLPDGSMLDFSGRHIQNHGYLVMGGGRPVDHCSIKDMSWSEDFKTRTDTPMTQEEFVALGAIRIDFNQGYAEIAKRPTKEQEMALWRFAKFNDGWVTVELHNDGGESIYGEYEDANPRRVVADVMRYFDAGIKTLGNVKENAQINGNILREYLEKDYNLPLYKYFKWASTASSCEKAEDLAYSCSYYIKRYIKEIYYRYSEFEDLLNDDEFDYEDDSSIQMFLNMLEENKLCDHFVSEMGSIADYYELPSWYTMDFNRIVKNEWCIHFGSDSESIAQEGFTGGTPDIDRLAYTNAGTQKSSAGYDFAFLIDDRSVDYSEYGDEAVIFRTSGVEVFHYGDNQNQVVFWGPNVKNFIPIHQDNGDWVVYGQNGQVLVRCGRPSEIALWATENLPQYRKQIMTGKNGFIPKYYDYANRKSVPYPLYRNESIQDHRNAIKLLKEESVLDGSSTSNPYKKRWDAERKALKDFICHHGVLMQSIEDNKDGKLYKCFYDKGISDLIGYNFCLCVQWDAVKQKPKSIVYIRAWDKFSPNIRQVSYDTRGMDNLQGTYDDVKNYTNV